MPCVAHHNVMKCKESQFKGTVWMKPAKRLSINRSHSWRHRGSVGPSVLICKMSHRPAPVAFANDFSTPVEGGILWEVSVQHTRWILSLSLSVDLLCLLVSVPTTRRDRDDEKFLSVCMCVGWVRVSLSVLETSNPLPSVLSACVYACVCVCVCERSAESVTLYINAIMQALVLRCD